MSLSEKLEAARVALGKRKERELQAQGLLAHGAANKAHQPGKPTTTTMAQGGSGSGINNNNKLLAGHLAHEFLSRGTLLGRRVEPSRGVPAAAAVPAPAPAPAAEPEPDSKRRYVEASWLLMTSGAHIPGVVNPTQLARWLKIKE